MIVDASVAVKWVVEEDQSDEARLLLSRIDLAAPTLLHSEVANAIWKKQRRGELQDVAALLTLPGLLATIIQTVDETPVIERALALARMLDHPVYDCVYVALAELMDDEVVTADRRFLARLGGRSGFDRVRPL